MMYICCFLFKQKTAYEMGISDWSSDVCSSDLRTRHASISLSADGIAVLRPLSAGGRAWTSLLDAETLLTVRVTIGTFEAVGAARLGDPCHEDRVAIAQRVFESACEELTDRNSLDLAHVIAGARERVRLQREMHDSDQSGRAQV